MAFALKSKSQGKTQGAEKSETKRKSARGQHSVNSRSRFGIAVFQPSASALTAAPVIQAKLKIGEPNDKFEQEADRMADEVMRMPDSAVRSTAPLSVKGHPISALNGTLAAQYKLPLKAAFIQRQNMPEPVSEHTHAPRIQRLCPECEEELRMQPVKEEEEQETLHTKKKASRALDVGSDLESQISVLRSRGQPLPQSLRAFFEPRFNVDFSSVRLHTDTEAARDARDLGARAFTVGTDIVFGRGEYAPSMAAGRRLLAHELTHVVQQSVAPEPSSIHLQESPRVRRQETHESCAGRESDIREGMGNARRLARNTVSKLEQADEIMRLGVAVSSVHPSLATAIQNAFGRLPELDVGVRSLGEAAGSEISRSSPKIRKLIELYSKVSEGLQNERLRLRCDTALGLAQANRSEDSCGEFLGAFVIFDNPLFTNDIFLCPQFLAAKTTPPRRGLFLIHEMAHSVLRIGHEGGVILDIGCGALRLTFDQATKNAYAYDLLAECLHAEESETAKGEDIQGKTPPTPEGRGRRVGLTLSADVSPFEKRILRRFASLGLDVPLGTGKLAVFNPSIGFQILSVPGTEVRKEHIVAAMVDLGLRIQRPLTGVYLDIEGGVFAGARFEPGTEIKSTVGLGATLGIGYHWNRFEIGAEASLVAPRGDNSRVFIVGRGSVRF